MYETIDQVYERLLTSYKEPLIWYFRINNDKSVSVGKIPFMVFYKEKPIGSEIHMGVERFFIDMGYCYEVFGFGYNFEYDKTVRFSTENNVYKKFYNYFTKTIGYEFDDIFKYEVLNNDAILIQIRQEMGLYFTNDDERAKWIESLFPDSLCLTQKADSLSDYLV